MTQPQVASPGDRPAKAMPSPVVILGIGNSLLADDGVGVRAVDWLRPFQLRGVELIDGGTLNFTLLPYVETAGALLVIDAAEFGAPPGSVRVYEAQEMDRIVATGRRNSVHEAGLADLLGIARLNDTLPARRALITVQPGRVGWGDALTPEVAQALPAIGAHVRAFVQRWHCA